MQLVLVFISGLLFGLGLTISQMINPEKVLAFLDITGRWDPSLAFVMGGALIVTSIGYAVSRRRASPLFSGTFPDLRAGTIDPKLVLGSALFGIGWGLVGFCPGPAISALVTLDPTILYFVLAMMGGMGLRRAMERSSH